MSVYETGIINPKKRLEFYKDLSEQLLQENKKLKKQLEEYQLQNIDLRADIMIQKKAFPHKEIKDKTFYDLYDMPTYEDLLNQQKEFIKYLEDEINKFNELQKYGKDLFDNNVIINVELAKKSLEETNLLISNYNIILSKYKEIIGDKE